MTRPEGIAEADWEKMNLAEKVLCATGSFRCGTMIADALKANAFAEEQADGGEDVDNIFDAIRHAYWSALMTRDMGSTKAKLWNEAHEWGASDAQAICMDRYNNAVGRKIGQQAGSGASDAKLRQLVLDAANQGDLKDAKGC